ncbi:class A beta-lactamase [Sphingosinicellaceae bacterium]|nr:class A beta-lactamase [Sphingosinicellaceae bacterium]
MLTSALPAVAVVPANPFAELERLHGGRLGVYAIDLSSGHFVAHRAGERFKLQSSFKGLLTAMMLHQVATGRDRLDAPVRYSPADLLNASPVTTEHVAAGTMTVGELCAATMATSDNAAANLLMRRMGGPLAVTAYLRSIGDRTTRVDNYEGPQLATAPFPADTTTPAAVTSTIRRILAGPILPEPERRQWEAWMASNKVGRSRLRAAFPAKWESGDRTGTGDGICNDYAFARRPGRSLLLIAAYYAAPAMELAAQEAVIREVGRIIVDWQR